MADVHKAEIADRVAKRLNASPAEGATALNTVLDTLQRALKKGDRVVVTGFGAFEVRQAKERSVHSIKGGAMKIVPAHRRVGFSAGASLSAAIR